MVIQDGKGWKMSNITLELIVLEFTKRIEEEINNSLVNNNSMDMDELAVNVGYIAGLGKAIDICEGLI